VNSTSCRTFSEATSVYLCTRSTGPGSAAYCSRRPLRCCQLLAGWRRCASHSVMHCFMQLQSSPCSYGCPSVHFARWPVPSCFYALTPLHIASALDRSWAATSARSKGPAQDAEHAALQLIACGASQCDARIGQPGWSLCQPPADDPAKCSA
jgi:hypothetical protein